MYKWFCCIELSTNITLLKFRICIHLSTFSYIAALKIL